MLHCVPPYSCSVRYVAALFPCEEGSPFILSQGSDLPLLKSLERLYGVTVKAKYEVQNIPAAFIFYVKPHVCRVMSVEGRHCRLTEYVWFILFFGLLAVTLDEEKLIIFPG